MAEDLHKNFGNREFSCLADLEGKTRWLTFETRQALSGEKSTEGADLLIE